MSNLPNIIGGYEENQLVSDQPSMILNDSTCSICSKIKKDAVSLQCNHSFCRECINRWAQHNETCPLCRATFQAFSNLRPIEIKDVYIICRYSCGWNGTVADETKHFEECPNSPAILKPRAYQANVCPLCDNHSDSVCLTCQVGLTEHQNCTWSILPTCNHGYHTQCLLRWKRTHCYCQVCNQEL